MARFGPDSCEHRSRHDDQRSSLAPVKQRLSQRTRSPVASLGRLMGFRLCASHPCESARRFGSGRSRPCEGLRRILRSRSRRRPRGTRGLDRGRRGCARGAPKSWGGRRGSARGASESVFAVSAAFQGRLQKCAAGLAPARAARSRVFGRKSKGPGTFSASGPRMQRALRTHSAASSASSADAPVSGSGTERAPRPVTSSKKTSWSGRSRGNSAFTLAAAAA